jgi:5-methylcytosine-specific restriction protein A
LQENQSAHVTRGDVLHCLQREANRAEESIDMAQAARRPCLHPMCKELVKSGRCAKHSEQHRIRQQTERNSDEVMKEYRTARWMRMKQYMLRNNVMCQRILDDDTRCYKWATILHHIVSPRVDPDRMYDAENIICVCSAHHPNTPGEVDTSRYLPTVTD